MRCGDNRLGRRICWRWSEGDIRAFNYFYVSTIFQNDSQMNKEINEEDKNKSGVYQIINSYNNKCYIGSTKNFQIRYNKHKFELTTFKHPNQALLNAYKKYGCGFFTFKIIYIHNKLECEDESEYFKRLLEVENKLIREFQSNNKLFGYNLRISAESNYGISHSEEAKTRIKGKKLSIETRLKMSENRKGEKHHSIKINDQIAREIKLLIKLGWRNVNIASYFGLSKSTVNDIKNNGSWSHIEITEENIANYQAPIISDTSRFNDWNVLTIKFLLSKTVPISIIAEFLGIKKSKIKDIKSEKTYNHITLDDKNRTLLSEIINFEELKELKLEYDKKIIISRKSHSLKGSNNPISKLNEHDVLEIAQLLNDNKAIIEIAYMFNVTVDAIYKIRSGDNWVHITGIKKAEREKLIGEKHPNFKHSKDVVLKIRELTIKGLTTKDICEELDLEKTFVNRVKSGKVRSSVK
jgi:group I intron endonuclease